MQRSLTIENYRFMSTILDSLKKSSDKRGDNSKNSMDNFSFSEHRLNRNPKSYVVLILLLLTAVILYFGYQYIFSDENSEQVTPVKSISTQADGEKFERKDAVVLEEKTETQKKNKPNSTDVKQRIKEIKERRKEQQKALQALQKPPVKEQEQVGSGEKTVASNQKETTSSGSVQPNQKQPPVRPSTELQEVTQPEDSAAKQTHLFAYQLPFSIRKDLPQLKLNIHVFDKDPENRIAIINGVRFAIDDMIDDVVLVKDIVPEGVLLEFNNRVFLVPK